MKKEEGEKRMEKREGKRTEGGEEREGYTLPSLQKFQEAPKRIQLVTYLCTCRLREPEAESRTMFSRVPYRYTGRTLYQTQHDAARTNRNPEFSRSAGGHVTGTRSMDNCLYQFSFCVL